MGDKDAWMAVHLFLDIPTNVTLGIAEMQMQIASGDVPRASELASWPIE
jgi:hypothetical protein